MLDSRLFSVDGGYILPFKLESILMMTRLRSWAPITRNTPELPRGFYEVIRG